MGRWQPDALGRLSKAALELYFEQGYEGTTVAEIADRAGVTERTFYRYFADKREVLFGSSEFLQQTVVSTIADAPGPGALDVVAVAIEAIAEMLADNRDHSRQRASVISANPSLQERELLKLSTLAAGVVAALRERGFDPLEARLAADSGVSVFSIAFDRWIADDETRGFVEIVRDAFARLRAIAA